MLEDISTFNSSVLIFNAINVDWSFTTTFSTCLLVFWWRHNHAWILQNIVFILKKCLERTTVNLISQFSYENQQNSDSNCIICAITKIQKTIEYLERCWWMINFNAFIHKVARRNKKIIPYRSILNILEKNRSSTGWEDKKFILT